jgi:hypothetical protein
VSQINHSFHAKAPHHVETVTLCHCVSQHQQGKQGVVTVAIINCHAQLARAEIFIYMAAAVTLMKSIQR